VQILFTYRDLPRALEQDYLLEAGPGSDLRELMVALAGPEAEVRSWTVDGRAVRPEQRIGAALRDGSVLTLGGTPSQQPATPTGLVLAVSSGPEAGAMLPLHDGAYTIGRGAGCDLCLARDPRVSRRHATLEVRDAEVVLRDLGSTNGLVAEGRRVEEVRLTAGVRVLVGDSVLELLSVDQAAPPLTAQDGIRLYYRPPRIEPADPVTAIELPSRPEEPQRRPLVLGGIIAPVALGLVLAFALHQLLYLLFVALSPVLAITSALSSGHGGRRSARARQQGFETALREARARLAAAVKEEEVRLGDRFPDPCRVLLAASRAREPLYERRAGDPDLLTLRVGLGDIQSEVQLKGDETLVSSEERRCHLVPLGLDLMAHPVAGIVGPREFQLGLGRWCLAQLAALAAPEELQLAVLADPARYADWRVTKWLPHLREERQVACYGRDQASLELAIARLADQVRRRREEARRHEQGTLGTQRADRPLVILADLDREAYSLAPLARILSEGREVSVLVLALAEAREGLPEETSAIVVADDVHGHLGRMVARGTEERTEIVADLVSASWMEEVARALAPIRLARQGEREARIPERVSLLEVLEARALEPDAILRRWSRARGTSAPIGLSASGVVELDLARDGPHGIVAGTTTSGKSELLQTLVASLALETPPWRMAFVLIDYKGGSAFGRAADLPHTLGLVTDLDAQLTARALVSLGAELTRREALLARAGAKDIEEYERTERAPEDQLAHLLIVVDEFASLVEDQETRAFVDGLVDLARRGRSLGLHLLLATQRPAGVVSADIRANANLRICMRVQRPEESIDVIEAPLAARIPSERKGRGYLRLGHDSLVEFQAAWSSAPVAPDSAPSASIVLRPADGNEAEGSVHTISEGTADRATETTELDLVVQAVSEALARSGRTPPPSPWLEPLGEQVRLEELVADSPTAAPFALVDFPDEQRRATWSFDLAKPGNLLLAGDRGSGRTTALLTLATSLVERFGTDTLHLYAIDGDGGLLRRLETLAQCGGVLGLEELERIERLIETLSRLVERRRRMVARGAHAPGATKREQAQAVVVLIDRWDRLLATLQSREAGSGALLEPLRSLMRDGASLGVRFVVTGDRSLTSPTMMSLSDELWLLRFNDPTSYAGAGIPARQVPKRMPPGRALLARSGREAQIAVPGQADGVLGALEAAIAARAATDAQAAPALLPEPVSALPDELRLSSLLPRARRAEVVERVLVGVGGNGPTTRFINLETSGSQILIVGPPRSGRTNALLVMGASLEVNGWDLVWIYGRRSLVAELEAGRFAAVLDGRTVTAADLDELLTDAPHRAVLIDDVDAIESSGAIEALVRFCRGAPDHRQAIIATGGVAEVSNAFRGLASELKRNRLGLVLSPASPEEGMAVLGSRIPPPKLITGPGRGVLVDQGILTPLVVPRADVFTFRGSSRSASP
jgi:S-DNA-T family DNA segregation ATPase FtsK/SpoIIIE